MKPHAGWKVMARRAVHYARGIPPAPVRLAWFKAKHLLGIPTRSDRAYLVREFVSALDRGLIGPDCHVTVQGRHDGAGAQAIARLSALALAHQYGLRYVHVPFQNMAHAEAGTTASWAAQWETLLNLGDGELILAECRLPVVGIEAFMADRSRWTKPCVVSAGHFVRFTDRLPIAYRGIIPDLRRKYQLGVSPTAPSASMVICAHVRRGDVSPDDPETAHRAADLRAVENSIQQVLAAVTRLGLDARVKVFSQGAPSGLERLERLGAELHLDTPALVVFGELVAADVLIMGRSSFSFTAALINEGVKIYDPFARAPVPGWLVRGGALGQVSEGSLLDQLILRASARGLAVSSSESAAADRVSPDRATHLA